MKKILIVLMIMITSLFAVDIYAFTGEVLTVDFNSITLDENGEVEEISFNFDLDINIESYSTSTLDYIFKYQLILEDTDGLFTTVDGELGLNDAHSWITTNGDVVSINGGFTYIDVVSITFRSIRVESYDTGVLQYRVYNTQTFNDITDNAIYFISDLNQFNVVADVTNLIVGIGEDTILTNPVDFAITIAWSHATFSTHYQVYVNGVFITTTTDNSYVHHITDNDGLFSVKIYNVFDFKVSNGVEEIISTTLVNDTTAVLTATPPMLLTTFGGLSDTITEGGLYTRNVETGVYVSGNLVTTQFIITDGYWSTTGDYNTPTTVGTHSRTTTYHSIVSGESMTFDEIPEIVVFYDISGNSVGHYNSGTDGFALLDNIGLTFNAPITAFYFNAFSILPATIFSEFSVGDTVPAEFSHLSQDELDYLEINGTYRLETSIVFQLSTDLAPYNLVYDMDATLESYTFVRVTGTDDIQTNVTGEVNLNLLADGSTYYQHSVLNYDYSKIRVIDIGLSTVSGNTNGNAYISVANVYDDKNVGIEFYEDGFRLNSDNIFTLYGNGSLLSNGIDVKIVLDKNVTIELLVDGTSMDISPSADYINATTAQVAITAFNPNAVDAVDFRIDYFRYDEDLEVTDGGELPTTSDNSVFNIFDVNTTVDYDTSSVLTSDFIYNWNKVTDSVEYRIYLNVADLEFILIPSGDTVSKIITFTGLYTDTSFNSLIQAYDSNGDLLVSRTVQFEVESIIVIVPNVPIEIDFFTWADGLITTLDNLMSIHFLPNITIGHLVLIPFMFKLVPALFGLFQGKKGN